MKTLKMIARLLFVSLCICAVAAQQITQAMQNCHKNHADRFSQCFINLFKRVQPQLGGGIAELNLPPQEPLPLGNLGFRQSFPPVTVEVTFRNVKLYGITAFDLKYLNLDFATTRKVSLGLTVPSLTARGQYKIGGNVFLLPIVGDGDVVSVIDSAVVEGTGDIVREKGKVVLRNLNISFKVKGMKIRMENLFQENQVLSDTIHHFINENIDLVLDEMRPAITTRVKGFLEQVFSSFFMLLPIDILTENPSDQQRRVQRRPS